MLVNENLVEFAGLPGSGKTTVATSLLEKLNYDGISLAKKFSQWLHKTHVDRFFLPITAIKFNRVFRDLYQSGINLNRGSFPQWILILTWQLAIRSKTRQLNQLNAPKSIFLLLNEMIVEYFSIAIEVLLFRKFVIMDEGFIQRGIGIWMRSPDRIRNKIWNSYLECIPHDAQCIIFDTEVFDRALKQAKLRPRGVHAVLRWFPHAKSDDRALEKIYGALHQLFKTPKICNRANLYTVNVDASSNEVVEKVFHRIVELNSDRRVVIFPR